MATSNFPLPAASGSTCRSGPLASRSKDVQELLDVVDDLAVLGGHKRREFLDVAARVGLKRHQVVVDELMVAIHKIGVLHYNMFKCNI
jgi:hypothetical protein